jgi:hypothetical protein
LLAVPVAGFVSVLIDELKRGPIPDDGANAPASG